MGTARAHGLRRGVTQYLMLPNRRWAFCPFPVAARAKYPFLVITAIKNAVTGARKSDGSDAFNDEIVMTPEMNFSKREKEILGGRRKGRHQQR